MLTVLCAPEDSIVQPTYLSIDSVANSTTPLVSLGGYVVYGGAVGIPGTTTTLAIFNDAHSAANIVSMNSSAATGVPLDPQSVVPEALVALTADKVVALARNASDASLALYLISAHTGEQAIVEALDPAFGFYCKTLLYDAARSCIYAFAVNASGGSQFSSLLNVSLASRTVSVTPLPYLVFYATLDLSSGSIYALASNLTQPITVSVITISPTGEATVLAPLPQVPSDGVGPITLVGGSLFVAYVCDDVGDWGLLALYLPTLKVEVRFSFSVAWCSKRTDHSAECLSAPLHCVTKRVTLEHESEGAIFAQFPDCWRRLGRFSARAKCSP